jgi:hypothetical protein
MSMFSQRHYVAVAELLNYRLKSAESYDAEITAHQLCKDFADMFASDNERFKRERFMRACEK